MRFPGSKLLSQDLSTKTTPFDSIIRHCEDVNLSGYMEIAFDDAEGLLLFYLGEQINIIYRQGNKIFLSGEATLKLRNTAQLREGKISIFELPLDMAHMLRGLSNRKEIFGQIFASDPLKDLIKRLASDGHTGSLEVLTNKGTGMILQVRGRFSTAYFETEAGVTFEKKEALNKIYELLDRDDISARVFQSDFSSDIWKARQHGGTGKGRPSRLQELLEQSRPAPVVEPDGDSKRDDTGAPSLEDLAKKQASERKPLQEQILSEIRAQTPSLLATFFFDLKSEEIKTQLVAAPEETADRLIVDKLPAFVKYLENLAAMRGDDHVELFSMSTENFYLIVRCIREAEEGIALITDRSQPATLSSSLVLNCAHRYVAMLAGAAV